MNKSLKMIIIAVVIIAIIGLVFMFGNNKKGSNKKEGLNIVTTTFSTYDFVKHIVGEKATVEYLLGPGVDAHSYEPTASDLIKLQNADILIYIGGEMEKWMDKVLETDTINLEKTTLIQASQSVDTIEEQEIDGAEEEEEEEVEGAFDEHIWTSPANAIKLMESLNQKISEKDEKNNDFYTTNTNKYIEEIKVVQEEIGKIVDNKKRDVLVFGDKMPMQYFLNEYGLKASAAFSGCSTETEPSSKTIAYLINKVREENVPVVLYIELSTGKTAMTIAEETKTKAMQIQTLHNVSKQDFENGETYVSLMTRNLEVLKEALQ